MTFVSDTLLMQGKIRVPMAGQRELQAADQDAGPGLYRAVDDLGAGAHR